MNKLRGKMATKQKISRLRIALMLVMLLITSVSLSLVWGAPEPISVSAVGGLTDRRPVGSSIEGYWKTPPQGYLLEDGSAVSRTTYSVLFSIIGTTFGAGDGSTTFNLPDSRGKIIVAKSTDTEFNVLGETGGEKYHTLTTAEMPSHQHDFSGHAILWGNGGGTVRFREDHSDADRIIAVGGAAPNIPNALYTCQGCSNWSDTTHVGGGGAHNEIQPYITLNRAIKY